jgi:hypothetical protein
MKFYRAPTPPASINCFWSSFPLYLLLQKEHPRGNSSAQDFEGPHILMLAVTKDKTEIKPRLHMVYTFIYCYGL